MKRKLYSLTLILTITFSVLLMAGSLQSIKAQAVEFPHVEASKSVTPSRIEKDGDARVTINLRGAGGMIQTPVDVILLIDRSGSMFGKKIRDAKAAAEAFLEYMNEDDRAGLVSYSSKFTVTNLTYMTNMSRDSLVDEINKIKAQGATNIYDSIVAANDILLASERTGAPLVQVLLTDGKHNFPSELPDSDFEALAEDSKGKGIIIYTIGLGDDVNQDRLKIIAETTGGQYYFAANSSDLLAIYEEIGSKLSFAGTDIVVTETIPPDLTYNGDASISPDEESSDPSGLILKWDVGTLLIDQTWEVTYTATAIKALEVNPTDVLCKVEYITAEKASAIINLPPGFTWHNIAIINFTVAPPTVKETELVNLTVEVENQGPQSESFELRTDVNGTVIDNRNLNLDSGEDSTILFRWNTTGVELGKYIVTVKADPDNQIWETNKTDNVATGEVIVEEKREDNFWWVLVVIILIIIMTVAGITYGVSRYVKREAPVAVHRCPRCGGPLEYSRVARRWYCHRCRRYYDIRTSRKTPPPKPKGKQPAVTMRYLPPPNV